MWVEELQRALLDQPVQPVTANTAWQWWSEPPIVLRTARNTRCDTQWLVLASESMFQLHWPVVSAGLLIYTRISSVLCQLGRTPDLCRSPVAACSTHNNALIPVRTCGKVNCFPPKAPKGTVNSNLHQSQACVFKGWTISLKSTSSPVWGA